MASRFNFYPRSPCGERRDKKIQNARAGLFLSTLSLRRATTKKFKMPVPAYFYPRSPCGERQPDKIDCGKSQRFLSTLSLRRATVDALELANLVLFLSTLSLRRATSALWMVLNHPLRFLSTLSLRRATSQQPAGTTSTTYFYPRSPCGERRPPSITPTAGRNFYPRSPCGERQTSSR